MVVRIGSPDCGGVTHGSQSAFEAGSEKKFIGTLLAGTETDTLRAGRSAFRCEPTVPGRHSAG
jgi:hypothetical protein